MKTYISFLTALFLFVPFMSNAQFWQTYSYSLPIKQYSGKEFKLEADIRVEAGNISSPRLYVRVDTKSGMGFSENMKSIHIKNTEWKAYTIQGMIDTNAVNLVFGCYCFYSGSSYFDNFKLSIKNEAGRYETIYETGFENGATGWQPHNFMDSKLELGNSKLYTKTIVPSNSDHKNVLKITGSKEIPSYGADIKAGHYATVNGINLYYEIYGSGTPLVILHGNGGSINSASQQIDFFKKKYKVIAIDSRGQGNSIDDTTALNYDIMASDVNELLNQLHIDSAYVWGHSDGAILALLLAIEHPQKVKKAIAYAANLTSDTVAIVLSDYKSMQHKAYSTRNPKVKQLYIMMLQHPHIALSDLHKIKAEILVMSGDHDVIQLSHTLDIYKNIEKSNLCILPGATHGGAWEKIELFEQLAVDFFDKPFKK